MSAQPVIPTELPLSSLSGCWTYNNDKHANAIVPSRLHNLCAKVDNILLNNNQNGAHKYESKDMFSMIEYLNINSKEVVIGEFMNCFNIQSLAYNEISMAIFGNISNSQIEDVNAGKDDEVLLICCVPYCLSHIKRYMV